MYPCGGPKHQALWAKLRLLLRTDPLARALLVSLPAKPTNGVNLALVRDDLLESFGVELTDDALSRVLQALRQCHVRVFVSATWRKIHWRPGPGQLGVVERVFEGLDADGATEHATQTDDGEALDEGGGDARGEVRRAPRRQQTARAPVRGLRVHCAVAVE